MPLSTLFVLASVTDKLADFVTGVVEDIGLAGIFVLMTLESMGIPFPSEPTMLFAGFNVSEGTYSYWAVVTVAVAANLLGSWIAYGIGWFGRIELLEQHGRLKAALERIAEQYPQAWAAAGIAREALEGKGDAD